MGLLRFLLAVCVVSTHVGTLFGVKWMAGLNAVVVFFIISGFYMALILNEKYTPEKSDYKLFITNRLLRLMPVYWIVLITHFILCSIGYLWKSDGLTLQLYVNQCNNLWWDSWFVFVLCNLFILGQDTLYYVHLIPSQGLAWSVTEGISATWFMLIFPAWTLSIELLFYFIAPFILRNRKRLIMVTILVLMTLLTFKLTGIDAGNLTKTQFVPYLVYFLAGGIAWLMYKKIKWENIPCFVCIVIFIAYIICLFMFPYFNPESELQILSFYVFSFIALPFIFHLTKGWKWDAKIGEYSYPIYITHIMANDVLKLFESDKTAPAELNLLMTLIASYFLIRFVSDPLERLRQKRINLR